MNAGTLRHRVEIQRATKTRNAIGEPVETWATVSKRWASIEPLTGTELYRMQQVQANVTHRVRMRYADGVITTEDRILHDGRYLNVLSVAIISERGAEFEIMCKERV